MSDFVDATAYLIVEGKRPHWKPQMVTEAKVIRATQGKPNTLVGDQIAVKITLRIPSIAFNAFAPDAIIFIPEELIQMPVEVEAIEP